MLVLALAIARPLVVAYVPNWGDLAAFSKTIDYAKVTHLDVAFENPADDAGNLSSNPFDVTLLDAAHRRGVKVLVSIGGGGIPDDKILRPRYAALLKDDRRPAFVRSLAAYVVAHGFDGLDVDLEGPIIDANYGAFVRDLGAALHAKGKTMTAALSRGYGGDRVPSEAFASFDFANLMAYDATGPWAPDRPGQHASLQMAKDTVAYFVGRGLPKEKAVLGIPFYGYGFGKDAQGDEWSYAKIVATFPGAERLDQVGQTVWYNGIPTVQAKAKLVRDLGLAGAMIWSLDSDVPGERSLLTALDAALRG